MHIYPSLPSGNALNIESTIQFLENYVTGFHLDVMDLHFVPNLTFGPAFINQIRQYTKKELWVHAMVANPLELIKLLKLNKTDRISIHIETLNNPDLLRQAQELYPNIGLAIKPGTHLGELLPFVDTIDHILVMSVEPGYSGQQFLESTWQRLEETQKIKQLHPHLRIKVDGGINNSNIQKIASYADAVAVSSAIFHDDNLIENLRKLA